MWTEDRGQLRSERYLAAVRTIDSCVLCGRYGTVPAHRNEGKGTGLKVHDFLTAALCAVCHREIDQGKDLTRPERRAAIDDAIIRTLTRLILEGKVSLVT